jgi:hypothetical protein
MNRGRLGARSVGHVDGMTPPGGYTWYGNYIARTPPLGVCYTCDTAVGFAYILLVVHTRRTYDLGKP